VNALILSNALDTNGQNARFARASAKYGNDPTVLKALAIGKTDPAGVVGRFEQAAEKLGGLHIRSVSKAKYEYLQFPMDIFWEGRKNEAEIKRLAEEADLIHLNNSWVAYRRFHLRKPALLHHHGSMLRSDPPKIMATARHWRMTQAVSTIDLMRSDPKVLHWLPSAYDIDELQAFRTAHRREPDGKVRIVHCPTNRKLKHTDLLVRVVAELEKTLPVELVLVEGRPWAEAQLIKATADIVFDQLAYGYGCNSIEAWGMGIPVISGADDWTLERMAKEWPTIPFEEANEQTLAKVMREMVKSEDLREDAAQRGLAHVRRYHGEKPALERLAELYHETMRSHAGPARIPGKGVTFRNRTGKPVYDDEGGRISFEHGIVTVDDPYTVQRLRTFATKRPGYGIEEVA
jgi:glycosyltransferase involved in cell wall biosynthesis